MVYPTFSDLVSFSNSPCLPLFKLHIDQATFGENQFGFLLHHQKAIVRAVERATLTVSASWGCWDDSVR